MIGERGRDLIHHSNVTTNIRCSVYKEAHRNVTMINGLIVIDIYGKQATRYDHFCLQQILGVGVKQEW